jgi:CubicO group peptidase (beta-lactamase class C family)
MWLATSEPLPRARMASGYFTSASRPDPVHAADIDYSVAFGTGDIASDLVTMVRFWRALLDPNNPTGITVADLTADMGFASNTPFHPASLGVQYGYGVEVAHWAGRRVVGHPGSIQGYRSGSWIDPELGIAISLCITSVQDLTEDPLIAGRRYPGPQLYTAALGTAYAMHDLINGEFAPA